MTAVYVDYMEDDNGNLTKILVSDKPFKTYSMIVKGEGETRYAIELTEDMEGCIREIKNPLER